MEICLMEGGFQMAEYMEFVILHGGSMIWILRAQHMLVVRKSRLQYNFMGDNEDFVSDWEHGHGTSNLEAKHQGLEPNVGVVHLIDDSDRTSDSEFIEAMQNIGGSGMRRKARTHYEEDGIEVE
ncbi:hypothetical protein LINPERHAP1_LOCUS464 [Linum perenne]